MSDSTVRVRSRKVTVRPKKPRPDFPLFPHATGRWAKKVRGKFCYFGKVADDPQGEAALKLWFQQKDELLAGFTPRANVDGLTVEDLADHFLNAKRPLLEMQELSERDFALLSHAVRHGIDREQVWLRVQAVGKFAERGRDYFDTTSQGVGPTLQSKIITAALRAGY